jgi:hypothetical protein
MNRDQDYIKQLLFDLVKIVKKAKLPESPFGKKYWELGAEDQDLEFKVQISNTDWVLVEYYHKSNNMALVQVNRSLYGSPKRWVYAHYNSDGQRGALRFDQYADGDERDLIYKFDRHIRKGLAPNSIRFILGL